MKLSNLFCYAFMFPNLAISAFHVASVSSWHALWYVVEIVLLVIGLAMLLIVYFIAIEWEEMDVGGEI